MSAGGIWRGFCNDAGDEPSVRMFVSEALQEFGYETVEASDATSGLKHLDSNARFDLRITDVGLPGG